jgi:CRP-like cAMP-binding protein
VLDMTVAGKAKSEILDLVYRHAKATGLFLAPQAEGLGIGWGPPNKSDHVPATRTTQLRLLDAIALFSSLTEDEKEVLAASMTRRTFRKDEILAKQDEVLKSLMILRSGVAVIKRRESEIESELTRLAPGTFFGEGGLLTGAGEPGTVQALTFVVVYEITQEGLAKLMRDRPTIAEELGVLLARRTAQARHLHESGPTTTTMEIVPSLVARIRHLFEL